MELTEKQQQDMAEHEAALARFGGVMPEGGKPNPNKTGYVYRVSSKEARVFSATATFNGKGENFFYEKGEK